MSDREYATKASMFQEPFGNGQVISPDAKLIDTLHKLLDMIPEDNHALMIDYTVNELLRFHNPNVPQRMAQILPPEES